MTIDRPPVRSKRDMQRRLAAGEFGNTLRIWPTLAAMAADGYDRGVYVRSDTPMNPGFRLFNVPAAEVPEYLARHGVAEAHCRFYETPPDRLRAIQGELMDDPDGPGLYLYWSRAKLPLRHALNADGRHSRGVAARTILEHCVSPESREHLGGLLDAYSGHVVEFSEFSGRVGVLGRRLVVWEIRAF